MANNGINRRNVLAATAGGFTLGGLYHTQAAAQESADAAPPADDHPLAPGWRSFAIGEAKVTQILDGIRVGEGPHPTFGENQDAAAVAELMRQNLLPENRFANFFQPTVMEIGGEVILVDTGFGEAGRENGQGLLVQRMQAAGYRPEDVTTVLLTHYHGDHINGLMTGGSPSFPNARLAAGRVEHEFWTSDAARAGPSARNAEAVAAMVLPLEEDMRLLEDGEEVMPGLTARAAFGHTPGMLVFELASGGQRLFLTADVFGQFVVSIQRPDWHVHFDMDKEAAVETRRRMLALLADEGVPFTGYHLPFPALGRIQRDGEDHRFVPESYALLV